MRIDKGTAFIGLKRAQKMLGVNDSIHEIAFTFHNSEVATVLNHPFWVKIRTTDNEALNWKQLFPSLRIILDLQNLSTLITGIIVFLLVLFIIMNTLFMALFERMVEFGIMRALGTRPTRLTALIVIEASSIAVVSIVFGMIIGLAVIFITQFTGIDYTGIDIGGVTFAEPIYPVIRWPQFTIFPLAVLFFTIIASFYPAITAACITPVKAMKKQ